MTQDFGRDICFIKERCLFRLRAAAVIVHDGKVLMSKNDHDEWYYSVGGAVQHGEGVEEAVKREVAEECGVEMEVSRLLAIHQNFFRGDDGLDWHELAFYYLMDTSSITDWDALSGQHSVTMNGLPERMEWVSLAAYEDLVAYPVFFKDLDRILNEPGSILITTREV